MPSVLIDIWDWVEDHAAAIIALCALFLTIYQARLTRRHNRLSVRPLLTSYTGEVSSSNAQITFSLTNSGLGPALIDAFEVTLDGAPVNIRATEQLNGTLAQLLGRPPKSFSVGHLGPSSTLRKDETRELFNIQFPVLTPAEFEALSGRLNRIRLVVKYHSLYNEPYVFDSGA